MIHRALEELDRRSPVARAQAHCDIPCGIYDPIVAQIAALTVIRMIDLIKALADEEPEAHAEMLNALVRYVSVKEEHAIKCKSEIAVIWGDYIKAGHLEAHPELHGLVHTIMQLASKCKQTVDRQAGLDLLDAVNRFAEVFWDTKGVSTKRAKAPYMPGEEVVYPNL